MRARYPDVHGTVDRDGVSLSYDVYGEGDTTVLLLPTWTIIHSRFWKMQVPYLARHYRVITYDGPGNGGSDRVADPVRYSADAYADDAVAVLDACGVDQAVAVGLSLGGQYGVRLAATYPERVIGLTLVGPALPLAPPSPERELIGEHFREAYPDAPQGWQKYNVAYWHDHYEDFATFFFDEAFSEPHSTKPKEDAVRWALQTGPEILEAESNKPPMGLDEAEIFEGITCPTLVVHGTADRIMPHEAGRKAAELSNGTFISLEGSGHIPNVRDPVRFNLALRDFIERIAG